MKDEAGARGQLDDAKSTPEQPPGKDLLAEANLTSAKSRKAGEPKPLRVLLAEDDMMNALLATTVLETLGCEVITVGTGNDAVNAVTNEPFDIVLMDFHMPSMNGLDATRTIRQWEADQGAANDSASQKRIPIIAITASAMPHERDACLAAGMDEVLVKPFRFDHLKSLLEQWAA